jgi:hypothetical protein
MPARTSGLVSPSGATRLWQHQLIDGPPDISHVPPFAWGDNQNRTVQLGSAGNAYPVADGSLEWKGVNRSARFAVLPGVAHAEEVYAMLSILHDNKQQPLDADPDSVDWSSTRELWLEVNNSVVALAAESQKPDSQPDVLAARQPMRDALLRITRKILRERITPFVRQQFPHVCDAVGPRACTPCESFIRRYSPDERRRHARHLDMTALVSVVVSLSDHGTEYRGGLYVSPGTAADRRVLALARGDAIVHQSDLLHGVELADDGSTQHSWIIWYRDSDTCDERAHAWDRACAAAGNVCLPTAS